MRQILMAVIVAAAVLAAGCGGDDDGPSGGFGAAADVADDGGGDGADDGGGAFASGDSDASDGAGTQISGDPDGELADFPIPSPIGAVDAVVAEVDGVRVAQVWYPADRYDEVVDAYEGWFLDNGLIATPVERVVDGQIAIGGQNDTGSYLATVVTAGDQVVVQLTVE